MSVRVRVWALWSFVLETFESLVKQASISPVRPLNKQSVSHCEWTVKSFYECIRSRVNCSCKGGEGPQMSGVDSFIAVCALSIHQLRSVAEHRQHQSHSQAWQQLDDYYAICCLNSGHTNGFVHCLLILCHCAPNTNDRTSVLSSWRSLLACNASGLISPTAREIQAMLLLSWSLSILKCGNGTRWSLIYFERERLTGF